MATDILGIGKLGMALLDKLGQACAYIHKPHQIKRIAKAEKEAMDLILKDSPEGTSIEINGDNIIVKSLFNDEYLETKLAQMICQEFKKQENIDTIIGKTIEILSSEDDNNEVNLDEEWIWNFMECCKFVSDDEMQTIWANILAQESISNGKYSLRTLNFLKNMRKEEALLFTKVAKNTFNWLDNRVLLNSDECISLYEITTYDIMKLDDLGLVNDSGKALHVEPNSCINFSKSGKVYKYHNKENKINSISVIVFTSIGNELFNLVSEERLFNDDELKKIFRTSPDRKLTLHEKDGQFKHFVNPIREIE